MTIPAGQDSETREHGARHGRPRLHGGSVAAYSDGPGEGSELVVRLPAARIEVVKDTPHTRSREGGENNGDEIMAKSIAIHEGVIQPSLVAELEAFRAPGGRVSSYYLNLDPRCWGNADGVRRALKNTLARERKRIDRLDATHEVRHALLRDCELVEEVSPTVIGERHTLAMACFVASESRYARALRLPWPVRDRAFFEDRFVLWPLRQVLDQSDRYAIILTDKDEARLFLFYLEQIEEVSRIMDEIPGRVRFPDPFGELEYMRKHIEHYHQHFDRVSETALRLLQREPFEDLIIGGLWETLPGFESRLHRYLRDRIVARWDIDVQHTSTTQVLERTRQQEQELLERQAQDTWKAIQDMRPQRGALGPEEVFAALWQRRVQIMLEEPDAARPGFHCTACGRLSLSDGPCVECGGKKADVPEVYQEAVHEAIDQSAQVRYWNDPALKEVNSIAALKRF
ncbi:MAG: baeRF10 domain-containing protein [Isosphaeraceae bacterium]|jgi:peptide subunit release factor 1 (eRF1)